MLKFLSHSTQETKKIAKILAKEILARPPKISSALVLALTGELGSGKTTFIQGFCRAAGVKGRIVSPTFVIFRRYKNFYHIDCYRLSPYGGSPAGRQNPSKELLKLGFKKIINNPQNIVLIEWAEKIKKLLPKKIIKIKFNYGQKENERIIAY